MSAFKEKILKTLSNRHMNISVSERIMYVKILCDDDKYRSKLINNTELIRKLTKMELSMVLPKIWLDKKIDHTRVSLLLQIYKGETSDKIIKSLKINEEIKDFYLNLYNSHMEHKRLIDIINKLDPENELEYKYIFDEDYGRVRM